MSEIKDLEKYGIKEIPVVCEICAGSIVEEATKFLLYNKGMKIVHSNCIYTNTPEEVFNKMEEAAVKISSMREEFKTFEEVEFDGAEKPNS